MRRQRRRGWARRAPSTTTGGGPRCARLVGGQIPLQCRKQMKYVLQQATTRASSLHAHLCNVGALLPRRRTNPLPADAVLIDEASMLSLPLAAALMDALKPKCQLVLVGDVDQLPPVGEWHRPIPEEPGPQGGSEGCRGIGAAAELGRPLSTTNHLPTSFTVPFSIHPPRRPGLGAAEPDCLPAGACCGPAGNLQAGGPVGHHHLCPGG